MGKSSWIFIYPLSRTYRSMKIDLTLTAVVFFHLANVGNGQSWSSGWKLPGVNTPNGAGKTDGYEKKSNGLLDTLTKPYLQKVTKPLSIPMDLVSKSPNSLPDVPDVPDVLFPIVGPVTDVAKSVTSIANASQEMLKLIPTLITLFQQLKVLGFVVILGFVALVMLALVIACLLVIKSKKSKNYTPLE